MKIEIKGYKEEKDDKLFWIVEFGVDKAWIEDGFELDDDRAVEMLANDLRFANIGTELSAKVLKSPNKKKIRKIQGY